MESFGKVFGEAHLGCPKAFGSPVVFISAYGFTKMLRITQEEWEYLRDTLNLAMEG